MSPEAVTVVLQDRPEYQEILEWIRGAARDYADTGFTDIVKRWGGEILRSILGGHFWEQDRSLPEDWDPRGSVVGQRGLRKIRDGVLEGELKDGVLEWKLPITKELISDVIFAAYADDMTPSVRWLVESFSGAKGLMYEDFWPGPAWRAGNPHKLAEVANSLNTFTFEEFSSGPFPQRIIFYLENSPAVADALEAGTSPEEVAQELERFRDYFLSRFFRNLKYRVHNNTDTEFNLTKALEEVLSRERAKAGAAKKELLAYANPRKPSMSGRDSLSGLLPEDWDPPSSTAPTDRAGVVRELARWLAGQGLRTDASIYEDPGFPIGVVMKGNLLKLFTADTFGAQAFRGDFDLFIRSRGLKWRQLNALSHIVEIFPASKGARPSMGDGDSLSGLLPEDWDPRPKKKLSAKQLYEAIHAFLKKHFGQDGADLMLLQVLDPKDWEGAALAIKQQGQLFDIIARKDHELHGPWLGLMDKLGYEVHEKYPFEFFFYPAE